MVLTLSVLGATSKFCAEELPLAVVKGIKYRVKVWDQEGGMAGTADCHLVVTCPFLL